VPIFISCHTRDIGIAFLENGGTSRTPEQSLRTAKLNDSTSGVTGPQRILMLAITGSFVR
jgi:hypothetical protein